MKMKTIKNMKTIRRILLCCFSGVLFFSACQDMLETESNRLVFDDEYVLNGPMDPRSAVSGILAEVQKVADRYVLLGELRSDLMKTTNIANVSLQEINQFQVSPDNEYASKYDYYNIINNCNFAIQRMDTSLVIATDKVMLPAYVEIKTIRAWTYFQLAQIFGEAIYLTEPITDLEASLVPHTPISIDNLVEKLIEDLLPYVAVPRVSPNVSPSFMPVAQLLGDLYLYQQNFQQAAQMYYSIMKGVATPLTISNHISRWVLGFQYAVSGHRGNYRNEILAEIQFDDDPKSFHSKLLNLSFNDRPSILPSDHFVAYMDTASYFYTTATAGTGLVTHRTGDLRGAISPGGNIQVGDAYLYTNIQNNSQPVPLIFKYNFVSKKEATGGSDPNNNLLTNGLTLYVADENGWFVDLVPGGLCYPVFIPVSRTPHLYLRYAEAVNRAGKPTLAFAVLKYGLTNANVNNAAKVNPSELGEVYTDFQSFDSNTAMAVRGRGYGIQNPGVYTIPDFTRMVPGEDVDGNGDPIYVPSLDAGDLLAAKQDSILWVEDRILEELAAETAFEGNRFFDLMCISRNRPNHPEFMAEKVSAKYENAEAMKAKLMTLDNWFLP